MRGWMRACINGCVDGRVGGWVNRCVNGGGWVHASVDRAPSQIENNSTKTSICAKIKRYNAFDTVVFEKMFHCCFEEELYFFFHWSAAACEGKLIDGREQRFRVSQDQNQNRKSENKIQLFFFRCRAKQPACALLFRYREVSQ